MRRWFEETLTYFAIMGRTMPGLSARKRAHDYDEYDNGNGSDAEGSDVEEQHGGQREGKLCGPAMSPWTIMCIIGTWRGMLNRHNSE